MTVAEVARAVCPARPVHAATVWRWLLHGVRGRKLGSRIIGGRRFVDPADLEAFLAALNQPRDGRQATPEPPSARAQRADAKLRAMGC